MIPRKNGSIVNIASITGIIGMTPPFMSAHYHSSKAAVTGITRQEAVEWACYNIRVNAIAPGFVRTPLTVPLIGDPKLSSMALGLIPLGSFIAVDDVAAAVCFLASDAASMITGVTLAVDGGFTAR